MAGRACEGPGRERAGWRGGLVRRRGAGALGGGAAPSRLDLPPLPDAPPVSVVIPAAGEEPELGDAVASALAQDVPGALEVVIAAAPGPSLERARELAAGDERVRALANPQRSTPAALNAAVAASSGQVIARLDAHAQLPPGYLTRALGVLRATGAANVGGRQLPVAERGFARAVAAAMRSPAGSGGARYRGGGPPGEVDTVYLGVFRREALEAVGGFDEHLVRNQDYELNYRLRRAGGAVVFHPDLAVAYRPRGSLSALWRQYLDYGRWKWVVLRLHPESVRARQLAAPLLVAGLGAGAVAAAAGRPAPLAVLAGAWLAVLGGAAAVAADRPRDTPAVVAALATMHLAWGLGFWSGAIREAPDRRRHART